jgi:hypothetical protein
MLLSKRSVDHRFLYRFRYVALLTCLSLGLAPSCLAGDAVSAGILSKDMATIHLLVGPRVIEVEVAATAGKRSMGLMHRQSMMPDHGMLFVFPNTEKFCMWMRNTLIPLSVAFLDEEGRILNIEEMLPQSDTPHCAAKNARYALEMNGGWFKRQGVEVGLKLNGTGGNLPVN